MTAQLAFGTKCRRGMFLGLLLPLLPNKSGYGVGGVYYVIASRFGQSSLTQRARYSSPELFPSVASLPFLARLFLSPLTASVSFRIASLPRMSSVLRQLHIRDAFRLRLVLVEVAASCLVAQELFLIRSKQPLCSDHCLDTSPSISIEHFSSFDEAVFIFLTGTATSINKQLALQCYGCQYTGAECVESVGRMGANGKDGLAWCKFLEERR